jgi:hypothetical protein
MIIKNKKVFCSVHEEVHRKEIRSTRMELQSNGFMKENKTEQPKKKYIYEIEGVQINKKVKKEKIEKNQKMKKSFMNYIETNSTRGTFLFKEQKKKEISGYLLNVIESNQKDKKNKENDNIQQVEKIISNLESIPKLARGIKNKNEIIDL